MLAFLTDVIVENVINFFGETQFLAHVTFL